MQLIFYCNFSVNISNLKRFAVLTTGSLPLSAGETLLLPFNASFDLLSKNPVKISFGLVYVCQNETFRDDQNLAHLLVARKDCSNGFVRAPYIPIRETSVQYTVKALETFKSEKMGRL